MYKCIYLSSRAFIMPACVEVLRLTYVIVVGGLECMMYELLEQITC
jgi:hypothetical protein